METNGFESVNWMPFLRHESFRPW